MHSDFVVLKQKQTSKMSKKRKKNDAEGKYFNETWESKYMFVLNADKLVCLFKYLNSCFLIYIVLDLQPTL